MRLRKWGPALFCFVLSSGSSPEWKPFGLDYPFPSTASAYSVLRR